MFSDTSCDKIITLYLVLKCFLNLTVQGLDLWWSSTHEKYWDVFCYLTVLNPAMKQKFWFWEISIVTVGEPELHSLMIISPN